MLRLFGWTRFERHEVTFCATDLVPLLGGFVLESQRFSNTALVLRVEVPANRVVELGDGLRKCGVHLDTESRLAIETYEKPELSAAGDVIGTLHVRFLHDEPDLRIETPAVPG